MTEDELKAIEESATQTFVGPWVRRDLLALVAEVRRLRAKFPECARCGCGLEPFEVNASNEHGLGMLCAGCDRDET